MNYAELESLVREMTAIADEANKKRFKFKDTNQSHLMEQSLGEALGVGKCMQLLIDRYPDQMNTITAPPETPAEQG